MSDVIIKLKYADDIICEDTPGLPNGDIVCIMEVFVVKMVFVFCFGIAGVAFILLSAIFELLSRQQRKFGTKLSK